MYRSARLPERFWQKVQPIDGCWVWMAGRDVSGYGHYLHNNQNIRAHSVAYKVLVGPVPEGLELDHLCRNRACVNPDHLEPVTHLENVRRGRHNQNHGKTKCVNGHEFTPENTYVATASGKRRCRTCTSAYRREWDRKKKAAS